MEAPSKTRTAKRKEGKEKGPPARAVVCGEDGSVVARKDGRGTDGAFFLERPKVKAIFPCRRGQCRPRAPGRGFLVQQAARGEGEVGIDLLGN